MAFVCPKDCIWRTTLYVSVFSNSIFLTHQSIKSNNSWATENMKMGKVFKLILLVMAIAYFVGRIVVNQSRYQGVSKAGPEYELDSKYLPKLASRYIWSNNCDGVNRDWQFIFQDEGAGVLMVDSLFCGTNVDSLSFKYNIINESQLFLRFDASNNCLLDAGCGFYEQFGYVNFTRSIGLFESDTSRVVQVEEFYPISERKEN